jgi:hypothetical protein
MSNIGDDDDIASALSVVSGHCCQCVREEDIAQLSRARLQLALDYACADNVAAIDDDVRAAANRLLKAHFEGGISAMSKLPNFSLDKFGN